MPQVGAVIGAAVGWLTGPAILATVARVAIQTLVLRALTKTPKQGGLPINVTLRSTVAARQVIIGQVRASGAFIDYGCSGSGNKYLWYVIAWAGHQTEDALDGYIDKLKIPAADINNGTGAVATAALDGKLMWWTHRGTGAQTVDTNLSGAFAGWTSNHRLRGISYDVLRMERSEKAWPNGAPQNVNRVIQGALLYDSRLDSTNGGSGSHRADDPSTWEYSNNLALGIRWYLTGGSVVNDQSTRLIRYGIGETDSRIDETYWAAAANKCDESLSGANAPPSGAQARYTLDIELSCEQTHRDCLEQMLACGAADGLVYIHGKWRLNVAAYDATVHAFTQDDLHGDLEIDDTSGAEDRLNGLSSVHVDAARDYTEQTSKARTNSAYVTQDGGEDINEEIPLRGVTNEYRAQRICEVRLRQARQMRTIKMRLGRQGLKLAPWETFTFDHSKYGWSGKVFRCIEREVVRDDDGALGSLITARAEASSVYTDLETADYTTGTSVTNSLQSESPDAPTALTAIALPRAIEFIATLGSFWEQHGISELWENTTDSFGSATRIWWGRGTRVVIQKEDVTVRYYWWRVTTIGGQVSSTYPATNGVQAAAARDPNIIADPNFELATNNTYWQAYASYLSGGAATGVVIVNSGGVSGGKLQLTGDGTDKNIWNKRSAPYPVVTGQVFRTRVRWRRTGTLSSSSGTDVCFGAGVSTTSGDIPPSADVGSGALTLDRDTINAVTVNQWQESEFDSTAANVPKSSTQLPYLEVILFMAAACTSGVIEVDHIETHLV